MDFGYDVFTNSTATAVHLDDRAEYGYIWFDIEHLNNTIQALIACRDWCMKNAHPSFRNAPTKGKTLYEIFTKSSATSDPNPSTE
jgi:hypothetical protein